jgi:hypothetical protein
MLAAEPKDLTHTGFHDGRHRQLRLGGKVMRTFNHRFRIGFLKHLGNDGGKLLLSAAAQLVRQLQGDRQSKLLTGLNPALLENDLRIEQKPVLIKNRPFRQSRQIHHIVSFHFIRM